MRACSRAVLGTHHRRAPEGFYDSIDKISLYYFISLFCSFFHYQKNILNFIHVFVHFLCLPKENEPKEKALYRQVFFKDRLK